ncbi:dTDP-4-dehydrorhamnose 3,5-epimerase (plasmid) [Devosia neptuniae]|uniref:dTDP-4-dehydrorhamnose 3,5-epimerase n=1 Tax=Devosia neptuniae TaxID=191302 RepID=A0ABY6C6C0_9HYPH|nr:dTDP-4-dehydrorhamnose 3,5-epimerase [Devosia neptuniae]UXN67839.1 dTDP-4-dehydrorhamnose 3,5-epimerase [Devosia neptuniae]
MKVTPLSLPGLVLLEPRVFSDGRGAFFESFNQRSFEEATGVRAEFVQDNHSVSSRNVVRGLHYQVGDVAQGKLVRVVRGSAFDVAVDLRRTSATFGRWYGINLSAQNRLQMWIPEGFAHGFVALEETTEFLYKTTSYYSATSERCILWNDPSIAVEWPITGEPVLSEKDAAGRSFDSLGNSDLF